MKFLITGVAGFVGQHLARHLIVNRHDVYGLLHNTPGKAIEGLQYVTGDLCKIDELGYLKGYKFDGVFHLAALSHPPTSFEEPASYFETNALGTVNLCETLGKDSMIMQCSTPEVYGICPDKEIFETHPMQPMNPYGVSKAAADLYVLEQTRNNKLKAFITRAGSHTGKGRPSCYSISSDAIQIIKIKRGLQEPVIRVGNISSQRAVIDVRDVVAAYYGLMMKHITEYVSNGDVFHVSGRHPHPMEYYLDLMIRLAGVEAVKTVDESLVRKIDIPVQILNSHKVRTAISWFPIIPIEETLKSLLNYWEEEVTNGL